MNFKRAAPTYSGQDRHVFKREVITPVETYRLNTDIDETTIKDFEAGSTNRQSSLQLGKHKITAYCGLTVLKKPPLQDCIFGTTKKKHKKRKPKHEKYYTKDLAASSSVLQTNENFQLKDEDLRDLSLRAESLEEKLLNEKIKRNIQNAEKWMRLNKNQNYTRQRLLEKEAIKEWEDLAQTWFGVTQRKKEFRQKGLNEAGFSCSYKPNYYRPNEIPLISKKMWNYKKGEKIPKQVIEPIKKREKIQKASSVALDLLQNDFLEKLVFIDNSCKESSKVKTCF